MFFFFVLQNRNDGVDTIGQTVEIIGTTQNGYAILPTVSVRRDKQVFTVLVFVK